MFLEYLSIIVVHSLQQVKSIALEHIEVDMQRLTVSFLSTCFSCTGSSTYTMDVMLECVRQDEIDDLDVEFRKKRISF